MKNTKIALEAKEGALKRIKENIEKIYNDFIVNEKIYVFQKDFHINEEFYKKHKNAVGDITDIEDLVYFLNDRWLEQIRKEDNILKVSNDIAILIYKDEVKNAKEIGIDWPSRETFKIESDEFIKTVIINIMKGMPIFFQRININPDLWSSTIAAMMLAVPIEKIFECEESILYKYFAPKIKNDYLIIRINELTAAKDMNIIWDEVIGKQKEFTKKYGYINSLAEYPSRKADKIITLCTQKRFSHDMIHKELIKEGVKRKYTKREIRERINKYKKQTRQPFQKNG